MASEDEAYCNINDHHLIFSGSQGTFPYLEAPQDEAPRHKDGTVWLMRHPNFTLFQQLRPLTELGKQQPSGHINAARGAVGIVFPLSITLLDIVVVMKRGNHLRDPPQVLPE